MVSFHRAKFLPRGGPDGGDGGNGGSVYLTAVERLFSLAPLRFRRRWEAGDGGAGAGNRRTGRGGLDLLIEVPCGTVISEMLGVEKKPIGELLVERERLMAASGGRGGRGNVCFATPTQQAPRQATPGQPGQERHLFLELKLMLHAAIIGCPNSGKSSLLARLSNARPRVAAYPFTTTAPEIGVAQAGFHSFVLGEMPGLLPGAHQGRGLGLGFLKHAERARLLVHLLDGTSASPRQDWALVNQELAKYSEEVAGKPQMVVVSKVDLPEVAARHREIERELAGIAPLFWVSAATGEGVGELLAAIARGLGW